MPLGEGDVLGAYRIVRLIGRGGMGAVYLADDLHLQRKVAVKVLNPGLVDQPGVRERFVRESQIAASLDHPNILPIFEAGEAAGQPFIAMRYVLGLDLDGIIRRDGPLSLGRTISIIGQIASALDTAHAAGLIHRDVKPGNILIAAGSQPGSDHAYLSDFGLTKHAENSIALSRTGQLMGSVGYVAPEQIENRPIDKRADIYSLGCVLFECLAGDQAYPRDSEMATLYAHVEAPPPSLAEVRPELPPALDAVIAKALAKAPEDRYATAGDLARALSAAATPDSAGRHLTRGFLFSDLRGYTSFVESHGDEAAARLLEVYRRLVRDIVRRFGGAEIKTEGDSFYVVFPSASDAVRCGLAIADAAAHESAEHPERPIRVGIGVHAGESTETAEGYVGSAVNIAARVCAQAAAGEVLVTDTVRGLTRTSGSLIFINRGQRQLKGIAERMQVYAAALAGSETAATIAGPSAASNRGSRLRRLSGSPRRRVLIGGGAATVAVALAAVVLVKLAQGLTGAEKGGTAIPTALGSFAAPGSFAPASSPPSTDVATSVPLLVRIQPGLYTLGRFGEPVALEIRLGAGWTTADTFDAPDLFQLRDVLQPGDFLTLLLVRHVSADGCFSRLVDVTKQDQNSILGRIAGMAGLRAGASGNRPPSTGSEGSPIAVAGPFADFTVTTGNVCGGPAGKRGVWIVPASEMEPVSPDPGANWLILDPGSAARIIVFPWEPSGSALAIISSSGSAGLDAFLPRAESVLDTLRVSSRPITTP